MDLIRELLLKFEESDEARLGKTKLASDELDKKKTEFHLELMEEQGLLDRLVHVLSTTGTSIDYGYCSTSLGYDFLGSVRDPEIWRKTKAGALASGGFTLSLIADLAKGYLRKQIAEKTGIEL